MPGAKHKHLGLSADGRRWRGRYFEPFWGSYVGIVVMYVHDPVMCEGRELACVLHRPSEHPLRDWPLQWRADVGVMERCCEHGIGHPDPDDVAYRKSLDDYQSRSHGCDGCCLGAWAEAGLEVSQLQRRFSPGVGEGYSKEGKEEEKGS